MLRSTCITLSRARRSVNRPVPRMVFDGIESSTNTPTTQEFSSSSTNVEEKQDVTFSRVYTHPLSQVVLEHLQNVHGDWMIRKGLHRGLTIDRDGSFCINFSADYPGDDTRSGRIWTSYDATKKQYWLSAYKHELLGRYPLHQGEGEWACQMEKYLMRTTVDRMVERIAEAN
mmetsp:Transcript_29740/g.69771  ORF Transcript_29740/g.69771 Transcript_29740/m.69771 type:complete len:172 (+) Transcript_29740:3-518(+)